jgi:hypothetical protein
MREPHDELRGQVAIVTGDANGIGNAIARRYAAERANVVINNAGDVVTARHFLDGDEAWWDDMTRYPRIPGSLFGRTWSRLSESDLSGQRAGNPGGHPPLEYVQGNGAAQ